MGHVTLYGEKYVKIGIEFGQFYIKISNGQKLPFVGKIK